jgi:transcription elongation factor SPT6
VQDWNSERSQALERALNHILYPQLIKEIKGRLLDEAKHSIIKVGFVNSSLSLYRDR